MSWASMFRFVVHSRQQAAPVAGRWVSSVGAKPPLSALSAPHRPVCALFCTICDACRWFDAPDTAMDAGYASRPNLPLPPACRRCPVGPNLLFEMLEPPKYSGILLRCIMMLKRRTNLLQRLIHVIKMPTSALGNLHEHHPSKPCFGPYSASNWPFA